jgi:carbonic anhydrase
MGGTDDAGNYTSGIVRDLPGPELPDASEGDCMSAIDDCLANNRAFATGLSKIPPHTPPAKRIAVVLCMDARLNTWAMLGLKDGDAHVIRNAGGVVTTDVIRSLIISQRLQGTREVMLIHHTDCGMLKFKDDELKRAISEEAGKSPKFSLRAFDDVEVDLRQSIRRIKDCPYLPCRDHVRGFVYDVDTALLHEVS